LRKLATALLAVPVLLAIYLGTFLGRSNVARTGVALGVGALVALGVIAAVHPAPATATPVGTDLPLTAAAFRTVVATDQDLDAPVTIDFSVPMDRHSVAAALKVSPTVAVSLAWDGAGRVLTITPQHGWLPGTYHTITVDAGSLAASGVPMASPVRAAFLTRESGGARIIPAARIGSRVAVSTAIRITFDRPVDARTIAPAIHVTPSVSGTVTQVPAPDGQSTYVFHPTKPLQADTRYRLVLDGVRDVDGARLARQTVSFRTAGATSVVRFRPRDTTTDVPRSTAISVRFTTPMDPSTTRAAFSVTAAGAQVSGRITFAENGTVLVFVPAKALPFHAKVVMRVGTGATSRDGSALAAAVTGTFRTLAKPSHRPAPVGGGGKPIHSGGGGAVGGGSWGSVETYYLGLMNCTRTGGWVTSTGRCSSPGGRNVAALRLDRGISTNVSRPYAKRLAVSGDCSHFIGGNPGDRLRHAGYTNYTWAENLGCRSGNPRSAVLGSHRFFQDEKPYNGGHYVNLMNSKYDRVGIGVWVSHGRVRLVVDFYHP
jgi:Bacterial Ig-like domain